VNLGLAGKVALVAGSTRGIGRAIAARLVAEGTRVFVKGRDANAVDATVADLSRGGPHLVAGRAGDLSKSEECLAAVDAVMARWQGLHIVVSNIGTGSGTRGWNVGDDEWADRIEQNLYPAIRIVRAAAPQLAAGGGGAAVLVASIAGVEALEAPLPYAAAKAAVIALAKGLARDLAPQAIRVNAIAPGNILAPGGPWEQRLQRDRAAVEAYIAREVPLGRFGTPEEIADAVAFLASDRASFITGTCLVADGGQTRSF
jgi:3-oxoacyl-[acyl-carrier protein] reductase